MDILFSEFKKKDVIDVCTGKKLGKVKDIQFTFPEGKIKCAIVGGGIFGGEEQNFSFRKIEKVGEDAILVGNSDKCDCIDNKREDNCQTDKNPCKKPKPDCRDIPHNAKHDGYKQNAKPPFRFDEDDYE